MSSRNRSTSEKIADHAQAYAAISEQITPPVLRQMLTALSGAGDATTPEGSLALLQSTHALARLICANDRAAAIAAAVLTSGGGAPRLVPLDDEEGVAG